MKKHFPDGQTHHRYDVRTDDGRWLATVFLTPEGVFSTVSDYGNYGYWWGGIGGDGDIRRFLLNSERNPDYFRTKFNPASYYDGEATAKAIRKQIIAWRKDGTMSREKAREEYDLADAAREDFRDWYEETEVEDAGEFHCSKPDGQVVAFVERVMPRLCEMLRAELAAEKVAA